MRIVVLGGTQFVGRAFVVSWPIDHWAWLDDHPATFAGTDPR